MVPLEPGVAGPTATRCSGVRKRGHIARTCYSQAKLYHPMTFFERPAHPTMGTVSYEWKPCAGFKLLLSGATYDRYAFQQEVYAEKTPFAELEG